MSFEEQARELVAAIVREDEPSAREQLVEALEGVVKAEAGSLRVDVDKDGSPVAIWRLRRPGAARTAPSKRSRLRRFRVTSGAGVALGVFEVETPKDVLEALARTAGYASAADAAAVAGPPVIVSPCDVARGFELGERGVNVLVVEEVRGGVVRGK